MRKVLLWVAFMAGCLFNTFNATAQSDHKLSLGVGELSHAYLHQFIQNFSMVDWEYPGDNEHGTYRYQDRFLTSFPITANLHYECTIGDHFGLGICFGYDYMRMHHDTDVWTSTGDEINHYGETNTIWETHSEFGKIYRHIFNIMPEATIYWFKKRHVAMYSQLAAGIRLNVEKEINESPYASETNTLAEHHFTCHVSAVGVEFGGRSWRGFAQIGYGAQGITQLGVKHNFQGISKSEKEEE